MDISSGVSKSRKLQIQKEASFKAVATANVFPTLPASIGSFGFISVFISRSENPTARPKDSPSGAPRQQNLSIPFHQVLVDRCHFRIFIRLCRRLRHKETDADYQHQGHDSAHSFPRAFPRGPHREVSFRRRRCSLSFVISLKSITGRISIGPSPNLKPGCCETS